MLDWLRLFGKFQFTSHRFFYAGVPGNASLRVITALCVFNADPFLLDCYFPLSSSSSSSLMPFFASLFASWLVYSLLKTCSQLNCWYDWKSFQVLHAPVEFVIRRMTFRAKVGAYSAVRSSLLVKRPIAFPLALPSPFVISFLVLSTRLRPFQRNRVFFLLPRFNSNCFLSTRKAKKLTIGGGKRFRRHEEFLLVWNIG